MKTKSELKHSNTLAFYAIMGFLVLITAIYFYSLYQNVQKEDRQEIKFIEEQKSSQHSSFNPNDLTEKGWTQLGFTEKQAATILKYKKLLRGSFSSKEELKRCYVISDEKFLELEPFINLPNFASSHEVQKKSTPKSYYSLQQEPLQISQKFNPNELSQNDWEKLGFTEKQAATILKYKNYLGGSFRSKENLRDCFVISPEKYQQLANYVLLPEKSTNEHQSFASLREKPTTSLENFDPNSLDKAGWQNLGFTEKQAQVIINYRDKNLKGNFSSLQEIKDCFVISDEKFQELKPFITLKTNNNQPISTTENATSATDFSRVDLNTISKEQLIEFGFTKKVASSFVGFREKLGGFVDKNQIFETYDIDRNLAERLAQTAQLRTNTVTKYTLANAPESWLKTHPYFRYSADKILYYRISNENEEKIWKKMKIKPEYEAKMRLYLVQN